MTEAEELKQAKSTYEMLSIMLKHSEATAFALRIENEKQSVRIAELYKQVSELKLENQTLRGEK
jgi:hypothetical protein